MAFKQLRAAEGQPLKQSDFDHADVAGMYDDLGSTYGEYIQDDAGRLRCLEWVTGEIQQKRQEHSSDDDVVEPVYLIDLGCASGKPTVEFLAKALHRTCVSGQRVQVHGVDISPGQIALANKHVLHPSATFEIADLRLWSPPEGRDQAGCDAVVTFYALNHLSYSDYEKVVRRATKWIRPGGVIALGTVAGVNGLVKWFGHDVCATSTTLEDNRHMLEQAGCEVVEAWEEEWWSSSRPDARSKVNQFVLAMKS